MNETIGYSEPEISLSALQAGDRAEYARFVNLYSGKIYSLALRILNDSQDAEDVLQETFIKAFKALPGFEGRSKLSTWLYRIATNEALMLVRKRKPNLVLMMDEAEQNSEEEEPDQPEIVDWCCLPEEEMLSTESRKFLDEAVQNLSPSLRVVFLLRDVEGLSVKETADTLEISEAAVKTRLLRARLRLREDLTGYYGERLTEIMKNE